MEIETLIEGSLYAIRWDGDQTNCFDLMAETYNDLEFLHDYFHTNIDKLKYFWKQTTNPDEAAIRTKQEANILLQKILEASDAGSISLDSLFAPLHSHGAYYHPRYNTDVKAKGYEDNAPWVRVYAVKCEDNIYVITGFGLKLVSKMEEDADLQNELNKLDRATSYLKSIGLL